MNRSLPHHWHGGAVPPGRPVVVGVVPDQQPVVVQEAGALAQSMGVGLICVYTVGETARALAAVAAQHDARLVAVGPRRPGLVGWMDEAVGGSVAGRLAHTQHRPVLIVPPALRSGG